MAMTSPLTPANAAGIRWIDTQGRTCGFPAARPGYGIRNAAGQWLGIARGRDGAAPTAPSLWSRKAIAAEIAAAYDGADLDVALPRGWAWFDQVQP